MTEPNRRKAPRVPFAVPVHVDSNEGPIDAELVDVSLTGARLRFFASSIGFPPSPDLDETALQVASTLPAHFEARLHYKVLGPLLHRGMNMVRIGVPLDAPNLIELGCSFDRPLSRDEIMALGVVLPEADEETKAQKSLEEQVGEEPAVPVLREEEDAPEPRKLTVAPPPEPEPQIVPRFTTGVARRYRAFVSGTLPVSPPTLPCWSDQLNRKAIRVRVPRSGYEAEDVTGATVRFTSQFGNEVGLKLVEGPVHLWTGRSRVCSVELPEDPTADMLVTLAFSRNLRPAELKRLRLERVSA